MEQERRLPHEEFEPRALVEGVVFAALLSIPLWAAIAAVAIALFQEGPLTTPQSAGFAIAAALEAILLRHVWRRRGLKGRIGEVLRHTWFPDNRRAFYKQTALLGALVAAYLHYYFWDVQLQIAQLHRVTVFI